MGLNRNSLLLESYISAIKDHYQYQYGGAMACPYGNNSLFLGGQFAFTVDGITVATYSPKSLRL